MRWSEAKTEPQRHNPSNTRTTYCLRTTPSTIPIYQTTPHIFHILPVTWEQAASCNRHTVTLTAPTALAQNTSEGHDTDAATSSLSLYQRTSSQLPPQLHLFLGTALHGARPALWRKGGRQAARPQLAPGPRHTPGPFGVTRKRPRARPPSRRNRNAMRRPAGAARPYPKPGTNARHSPGPALTCRRRSRCHPGGVTGRRAEEAALGRAAQPPLRLYSSSSSGTSSNRKCLAGNTAAQRGTGREQRLSRPRRACLWSLTSHAVAVATAGGNDLKWWKSTVSWSFRPKAISFGGEGEGGWRRNYLNL